MLLVSRDGRQKGQGSIHHELYLRIGPLPQVVVQPHMPSSFDQRGVGWSFTLPTVSAADVAFVWSAVGHRLYVDAQLVACDAALPPTYDRLGAPAHAIHHLAPITIEPLWRNLGNCTAEASCVALRRTAASFALEHDCDPTLCFVTRADTNAIAVPYPTLFRAADDAALAAHLAWMRQRPQRTFVMAFVGGTHGQHPYLRSLLHAECAASAACAHIDCSTRHELDKCQDPVDITRRLHSATFCLQPDGDTPTRQSWFDSILCGCIPVFFSSCLHTELFYEHVYAPFLPAHARTAFGAGDWAVVLNVTAVYAGETVERMLRALDAADVRHMQARLLAIAPVLQYGNTTINARTVVRARVASLAGQQS